MSRRKKKVPLMDRRCVERLHKRPVQREGKMMVMNCPKSFQSEPSPPPEPAHLFFHKSIVISTLKMIPFIKTIFRPSCDNDRAFRCSSVEVTENGSHRSTEMSSLPDRPQSTSRRSHSMFWGESGGAQRRRRMT